MNIFSLSLIGLLLNSFFNLQFQDVDGNTINMSSFQGKKILIVNIATEADSAKVRQLSGLQQLQQRFADSLVVIAFPSNSYGHESKTNAAIKQFCQNNFQSSFIIASKSDVTGNAMQSVFNWLSYKTENGDMDASVHNDFQKFLIDKEGHLSSVMSSKVQPLDSMMIKSITANY